MGGIFARMLLILAIKMGIILGLLSEKTHVVQRSPTVIIFRWSFCHRAEIKSIGTNYVEVSVNIPKKVTMKRASEERPRTLRVWRAYCGCRNARCYSSAWHKLLRISTIHQVLADISYKEQLDECNIVSRASLSKYRRSGY